MKRTILLDRITSCPMGQFKHTYISRVSGIQAPVSLFVFYSRHCIRMYVLYLYVCVCNAYVLWASSMTFSMEFRESHSERK